VQLSNDLHQLLPSVHIGPRPGQPIQLESRDRGRGIVEDLVNHSIKRKYNE
jgi:hypothetical protein